jgi:polysaccharide deacetylase 2 family uncharacterized protein YibQ
MRFLLPLLFIALAAGCRSAGPGPLPPAGQRVVSRQKQLFVVIDDAGLALAETERFLEIPVAITLAVLPLRRDSAAVCRAVASDPLKEVILHQPMEALDAQSNPGAGAIYNATAPVAVGDILKRNLASVPGAVGMNNHMGSRVTENPVLMREVLRFCKANGIFFLDSKTAYNSQVPRVAEKEGMHVEERHVFLDIQRDREYIRRMWGGAVARARKHGYAVVIGHAWSAETAAAIRDSFETLRNQGYTFHKLSELYEGTGD